MVVRLQQRHPGRRAQHLRQQPGGTRPLARPPAARAVPPASPPPSFAHAHPAPVPCARRLQAIFYAAAHTGVIYDYKLKKQKLLQGHVRTWP